MLYVEREKPPIKTYLLHQPIDGLLSLLRITGQQDIPPEYSKAWMRWLTTKGSKLNGPYPEPSGLDGYFVGMKADERQSCLAHLEETMLDRIYHISRFERVPIERVIHSLYERRYTPQTARVLSNGFETMLSLLRGVGTRGFDMQAYSLWRTAFEIRYANIEKNRDQHALYTLQQELSGKLQGLYGNQRTAAIAYEEQRERTRRLVDEICLTHREPYLLDTTTGTEGVLLPVEYVEPIKPLDPNMPESKAVILATSDMGHPLVRRVFS
ncbi:hypothetical protein A3B56_01075 [Candidatus Roizmanbacteria bacterium RIFCSPLOWO2_01_FULL_45_11]|uniref:Uncharacterized protein n=1 Tax=Candidatus Roizmanbacteria bacterium RIFCSPLOWO2_01_FULL_45_11 TaxID=1802070 RepID=A0A1F7JGS8_9BACT|nr:MAG: hypothetical protein A3B56_01075 [Candidatus Roizmanbacteria bacterium RIFCSPLOWO2_01_FULL_45_11]